MRHVIVVFRDGAGDGGGRGGVRVLVAGGHRLRQVRLQAQRLLVLFGKKFWMVVTGGHVVQTLVLSLLPVQSYNEKGQQADHKYGNGETDV